MEIPQSIFLILRNFELLRKCNLNIGNFFLFPLKKICLSNDLYSIRDPYGLPAHDLPKMEFLTDRTFLKNWAICRLTIC